MGRMRHVSLDVLKEGAVLSSPLYDDQGAKLLGAGLQITGRLLGRLRARGVRNVVVNHDDLAQDEGIPDLETSANVADEGPFWDQVKSHGATSYNSWQVGPTKKAYQSRLRELARFHASVGQRTLVDGDEVRGVSINTMLMAAEDIDLFTHLATDASSDATKSCLNISMLAVALGINLGMGCEALIDLGSGCMLKDCSPMEGSKWSEVAPRAKLVAAQIDEFCDGSGAPKGLRGDQIHLLAKIAGVAKRFYHFANQEENTPHEAVLAVLAELKEKKFHPAVVRALLDTTSLYPIGSEVMLNDERTAQVIRAQRGNHSAPIVCIGSPASESVEVIDLAKGEFTVEAALPSTMTL